ncbi:MAG: NAD(P)H-dependent oxidoreductase subunit E [Deltaproteobacteria bacterium]|nr:NAD(P)H-dependent oxidoreductase subunit E [Deltaproteobacteria bacterium]
MVKVLSQSTVTRIKELMGEYPTPLAATLPALHLVQQEIGHLSKEAQLEVAEILDVPPTRISEVVSFYSMLYEQSVGRHVVKICRTLSCELRGAKEIISRAQTILGIKVGETSADGRVTLLHEECLASCATGPCLWVDGVLVENLTCAKLEAVLGGLL